MIFKKAKFYICVAVIMALIVITASSVFIFPVAKEPIVNVEGETDLKTDEFLEPDLPSEDEGVEGGTTEEAPQIQQTNIKFTNAWSAFNYAMKMFEKNPCYMTYYQKIDGKAQAYPVTIDATITRKIYNGISGIYVVNKPNTKIDVANLGIDLQVGSTFESHSFFDIDNNLVYMLNGGVSDLTEHKNHHILTTYELPYIINRKTAEVVGGLVNKSNVDYYEFQMELKADAYEKYVQAMKNSIGLTEVPKMSKNPVLTIRIDKKTGTFKSISSVEEIQTNYVYSGITAAVTATSKLTLTFDYTVNVSKKLSEVKKGLNIN